MLTMWRAASRSVSIETSLDIAVSEVYSVDSPQALAHGFSASGEGANEELLSHILMSFSCV